VSTSEQATEGVSLVVQEAKIQAYAVVKDWTVVEVIRDQGASAKSLHRPGLARLLALAKAGAVQVVVAKLDRLTRSVGDLDELMKLFARKCAGVAGRRRRLWAFSGGIRCRPQERWRK
jgi:site-specific DNA recombinase